MDFENEIENNDFEKYVEKESEVLDLDDIFKEAIENYSNAKESWKEIFDESIEDREFGLFGGLNQWDPKLETLRRRENRTVAVFNKCAPNIRFVVNNALRDCPAIKVSPKDSSKSDEAEAIADIVRMIENESNSKDVYSHTFQDAVAGGYSVFEICVDDNYDDDEKIKIKRILEPTTIYPDPYSIEPDFSDMEFLIREKSITKKEFQRKYPNSPFESVKDENKNMWTKDSATLLEYWMKKNGNVEWYILNGNEILDSSEIYGGYKGKYIPFVFIIGEDISINGERHFKSIIRDIKDYQKTLNYMESEAIDYVSKNSNAPYLVSDKSIEKYIDVWNVSNTKNLPYLPYEEGKSVPQRMDPPKTPIGYVESISRLDLDIRSTIGIRDPLQDIPATQSGKAIKLQMAQQNLGTYVWVDHLNRAIKHCGKILVDLIPHYFNYPHSQQLLGIDGQINSKNIMIPDENGKMLDLSGKYSVTISTGASYEDQRSETRDKLIEIAKINPQLATVGSDILARTLDLKESDELADRLFAMLPPQIQSLKSEMDPDVAMGQMKMKMDQMAQILQQTTQNLQNTVSENQKLQEMIQNKNQTEMMKIQAQNEGNIQKETLNNSSEERIAMIKAENDYRIKEMELNYNLEMKKLELEIEKMKSMTAISNKILPQDSEIIAATGYSETQML